MKKGNQAIHEIPLKEIFNKGYWRPNPKKDADASIRISSLKFSDDEMMEVLTFMKKLKAKKVPKKNCDCTAHHCCSSMTDNVVPLALCREILPTLTRTLEPGRGKVSLVKIFLALVYMTKLPHDILYPMLGVTGENDVAILNRLFSPKAKGKEISAGAPLLKKMIEALKLSKTEIHRVIYATAKEEGCDAKILTPKIKTALEKIS
jgi:hypothetical protein